MKLRVMTYNVQHFKHYYSEDWDSTEFNMFAEYLTKKNPDIVGMNEVRGKGNHPSYTDQTGTVSEKAGYANSFFAPAVMLYGTEPYGNALMSHLPFSASNVPIPIPEGKTEAECEPRCVIRADYTVNGKPLTVLDSHFGLSDEEARLAVKTVCDIADSVSNPIILMGDFNLTPDSPILLPLRERFSDTEELLPQDNRYTFPSYKPDCKIDYIFVRGAKVNRADIYVDVLSDHCPMEIEIEI